jgi:hypothetical protein
MPLNINVSTADSSQKIEANILRSLQVHIDRAIRQSVHSVQLRIADTCEHMIENTREYDSLLTGELLGELGIPDVERRVREILNAVRVGVEVTAIPVTIQGAKLGGGMKIGMIRSSFEDLLGLPAAEYVSNGRFIIPWLRWLLIEGDRIIISTHEITFDLSASDQARSRTGMALMRPGSGWRVPPEYSGTIGDNFITRAFDGNAIREHVSDIIREEIQRRI